ncbi:HNH endonuclease signature motif containing protein [Burkholderia sp. AU45274]|uniref:HNH endonuclease signature motif containing protein n=1 Tax=Burkholderia sp. AU45274 TaxID=3059205 RepID=UPI00264A9F28|nr:HNH endonuclease signature motif containing protein [Burkholderia sp. AU45274]MDN7490557.1 HNH endonuclease signature motif containing protein [Burkholderia sp. AU45274]
MKKPWSPEELVLLAREYPNSHTPTLAKQMGRGIGGVYQKALSMGLRKSVEYLASPLAGRTDGKRGGASRFTTGHVTWNKGKQGLTGHHPNTRRTQFKKGEMRGAAQHNYVPIGSHRISKDGYLERKVADDPGIAPARRWIGVHRLVWEAANGPIPAGHVVCFLPGQRTADAKKITLDALELVSRAELARRNHPRSRNPELAKLVQLKGAITRQVNRIARETQEQQS